MTDALRRALTELGLTELPSGHALLATHRRPCQSCGRSHLVQAVAVVQAHCRDELDDVNTCGGCHVAAGTGVVDGLFEK